MDLVVLGTGAGKTSVYSSECSSSYVLCHGDEPVILIDSVSAAGHQEGRESQFVRTFCVAGQRSSTHLPGCSLGLHIGLGASSTGLYSANAVQQQMPCTLR